jgi:hypothetical protein
MKHAYIILAIFMCGCVHEKRVYVDEKEATVRVIRITDKRDATYQTTSFEPGPVTVYTDIRFRVEAPETFRGREIVIPILAGMEGELFEKEKFTIQIPDYFLEGKRRSEVKMPNGITHVDEVVGFSFEGIVVKEASQPTTTSLPCPAETNGRPVILRWGENGSLSRWDQYYADRTNTVYPYCNQLPALEQFPKLLEYLKLTSYEREIVVSQLRTLSRCDFVDFMKQDYDAAYLKWRAWWDYYGSKLAESLKKEGRTYPEAWNAIAQSSGLKCPAYPLALPTSWSFQLSFRSGDYGGVVEEEISMSVSPTTATLKRRYHRPTDASGSNWFHPQWITEKWEGLTVEESQSFLASVIYAIDNPWVYSDDEIQIDGHIKGRPKQWTDYYPSVKWTGILDSEGRVLINDDVWDYHTTDSSGLMTGKYKFPGLDGDIGVIFRVVRDQFPDPIWDKKRSRWITLPSPQPVAGRSQ